MAQHSSGAGACASANQYCVALWGGSGNPANDSIPVSSKTYYQLPLNGQNQVTEAAADAAGIIYGKCQMMATYDTSPIKVTQILGQNSVSASPVKGVLTHGGCPDNQYCVLLWTGETNQTGRNHWVFKNNAKPTDADASAVGLLYGKCQMMATYDTSPMQQDAQNEALKACVVGTKCPAGKYCYVKCNGANDAEAANVGTLAGECLTMDDATSNATCAQINAALSPAQQ